MSSDGVGLAVGDTDGAEVVGPPDGTAVGLAVVGGVVEGVAVGGSDGAALLQQPALATSARHSWRSSARSASTKAVLDARSASTAAAAAAVDRLCSAINALSPAFSPRSSLISLIYCTQKVGQGRVGGDSGGEEADAMSRTEGDDAFGLAASPAIATGAHTLRAVTAHDVLAIDNHSTAGLGGVKDRVEPSPADESCGRGRLGRRPRRQPQQHAHCRRCRRHRHSLSLCHVPRTR